MGLGDGQSTLRAKIGKLLDKVLGEKPVDSEATLGATNPQNMPSASGADADAAGFPPEIR